MAATADLLTCTPGVRSTGHDEIMADFPDLQPGHIQGVLCDAAEREERLSELSVA